MIVAGGRDVGVVAGEVLVVGTAVMWRKPSSRKPSKVVPQPLNDTHLPPCRLSLGHVMHVLPAAQSLSSIHLGLSARLLHSAGR